METDDFLNLDVKHVMEWVSHDDITVSAEEEVFKGIVKWASHEKSKRKEDFPELLHQVRLTSVSHDFLLNELANEELVTKNAKLGLNFVLDALKIKLSTTDSQVYQQPRKCLETCTDGIFVCGGRKALCYFPQQNLWYRLADTLFNHENDTPTQCKGKIYIVGEACAVGGSDVMEYYVANSDTWGAVQRGTTVTACAVLKGHLYATYFSVAKGRIYKYDAHANYWEEMEAPLTKQYWCCVVSDEQFLYVIGGANKNGSAYIGSSITTRYDPGNNKWEEVAALNVGRYWPFGAASNNKVFTAGGKVLYSNYIRSCEVYNPTTNEWQLMPSLKVPRFNASMVCFQGRLYVLGGRTVIQNNKVIRSLTVEVFDLERNEWTEISTIPVKTFETRQEEEKMNNFQACFAKLYKGVIDKLKPLNLI